MRMRARLVGLVVALTVSLLGALGLVLASAVRGWAEESVDAELERRAEVLVHEAHLDDGRLELDDDDDLATRGLPFRIEAESGALLFGAETWPDGARGGPGFVTTSSRGGPVRILTRTFTPRRSTVPVVLRVAAPLRASAELAEHFRARLLLALAVAALLSAAGATWLARGFLGPLVRLSREADAVEAGSLTQRLDVRGLDPELARFANTINALLARVAASMNAQRDFIARASHALRTPLTGVLTQAEVTLRRERTEAQYREALETIAAATRDAAALTDGLLALTRAEAAESAPREDVVLRELTGEFERLFSPRCERAGLRLTVQVPEGLHVRVPRARLREALDVLLDNAVRYTPSGGAVTFTASSEPSGVVLEVADTGPGIAVDERERVFERFYRGAAAVSSGQPGSGLGLSVVQAFAQAEAGEVTVSNAPGGGAVVRLRLPGGNV